MPISLHAAFIPSALQMLGTAAHLIDKAEGWCGETGSSHGEIIGSRIHETMLPFCYQIESVANHTAGAIAGVRMGVFTPLEIPPPDSFDALRASIAEARAALDATSVDEMEGFIGQPMRFAFNTIDLPFTAEEFLLSFSQPNFYFHATTAYDILRMKGVTLAKQDFLGRLRLARS